MSNTPVPVIKLTEAKDVIRYTEIRLYTPLGGTYVASVDDISVENDLITLWVLGTDGTALAIRSVVCNPTYKIEVVKEPDLTPYGLIQNLLERWDRTMVMVGNDEQYVGAHELVEELRSMLPAILKAHDVVRKS